MQTHTSAPSRPTGTGGTSVQRERLLKRFFPQGVPPLWCPALTHYAKDGTIDEARMAVHLRHLAPHVKGLLIPGSTGDGWELTEGEFGKLLQIALEQTQKLGLYLLVGVLKPDAREAFEKINQVVDLIKSRTAENDAESALLKARVCGFTLCASRGRDISQEEMERQLLPILEIGLPIALYQLPQVTENEIEVELFCRLVERFPNLTFFKDSSDANRVVSFGKNLGGVFTMRGAEGNYLDCIKREGRGYDGFLLSSANSMAGQLDKMLSHARANQMDNARKASEQVTAIIHETFDLVRGMRDGNIYANSNKALDHFFAHGPGAEKVPGPRLHAGSTIPQELIFKTGEVLRRHGCMPKHGYLD